MAATKLSCPECGKVLRPAKPLAAGKRVKCPKCSAMFVAQDDEEASPASVSKGAAKSKSGGKAEAKSKPAGKKAAKKEEDKPAPPKAAPTPGNDDDDPGGPVTYSFVDDHDKSDEPEIDYVPDTSINDLRGPAQAAVMKPSNYMILTGVLCCLGYIVFAFIILLPIMFPVPPQLNPDGTAVEVKVEKAPDPDTVTGSLFNVLGWDLMEVTGYAWWNVTLLVLGCVAGVLQGGIVVYGGVRMQMLESRLWGMIAGVVLMIPTSAMGVFAIISILATASIGRFLGYELLYWFSPIIVLGVFGSYIATGLWAVLTLNKPEVIDGYEYVEE